MRIYYRQPKKPQVKSGLVSIGAQESCFKMLLLENDKRNVTKKVHHHTDFEMHIMAEGLRYMMWTVRYFPCRAGSFC